MNSQRSFDQVLDAMATDYAVRECFEERRRQAGVGSVMSMRLLDETFNSARALAIRSYQVDMPKTSLDSGKWELPAIADAFAVQSGLRECSEVERRQRATGGRLQAGQLDDAFRRAYFGLLKELHGVPLVQPSVDVRDAAATALAVYECREEVRRNGGTITKTLLDIFERSYDEKQRVLLELGA